VKVVLDANVWVSGFAARGLCADLLRLALRRQGAGEFELLPDAVRAEVLRVLREELLAPDEALSAVQAAMDEAGAVGPGSWRRRPDFADPSAAPILAASPAAGAGFFAAGDAELLALDGVDGLPIVSPRQMYSRLVGIEWLLPVIRRARWPSAAAISARRRPRW
jgi:predicted nucleic acid-binding protein